MRKRLVLAILLFVAGLFLLVYVQSTYAASETPWQGEYYDNQWFSGGPKLRRNDANLDFQWGNAGPTSELPADNFSVRWRKTVTVDVATTYNILMYAHTDYAKVSVNGRQVLIVGNHDASSVDVTLNKGQNWIVVEYIEKTGWSRFQLVFRPKNTPSSQPYATATPRPQQTPNAPSVTETAWQGEYFNSPWWAGQPALRRNDNKIDFSWGDSSPQGIWTDSFSARWRKTITLSEATTYRFNLFSAEGESRIVVNGTEVLGSRYRVELSNDEVELQKGQNVIYVEYQSGNLGAYMRVRYEPLSQTQPPVVSTPVPPPPTNPNEVQINWQANYYTSAAWRNAPGAPTFSRQESRLDHNWGTGSPAQGVPADWFYARWRGEFTVLTPGTYRISAEANDKLEVSGWREGGGIFAAEAINGSVSNDVNLPAGKWNISALYTETTGNARAKLTVERLADNVIENGWRANYFNGENWSGRSLFTAINDKIDFDWTNDNDPVPGLTPTNTQFSARWSKEISVDRQSIYRFETTTIDFVRLKVDGRVVHQFERYFYYDPWVNTYGFEQITTPQRNVAHILLEPGKHQIAIEYANRINSWTPVRSRWSPNSADSWAQISADFSFVKHTTVGNFAWSLGANMPPVNYTQQHPVEWRVGRNLPTRVTAAVFPPATAQPTVLGTGTNGSTNFMIRGGSCQYRELAYTLQVQIDGLWVNRSTIVQQREAPAWAFPSNRVPFFRDNPLPIEPCDSAESTPAVLQMFENGAMVLLQDSGRIYVFNSTNLWHNDLRPDSRDFFDSWDASQREQPWVSEQPPAGKLVPSFGFGKVWATTRGLKESLGWAVGAEQHYVARTQYATLHGQTTKATVFTLPNGPVKIDYDFNFGR